MSSFFVKQAGPESRARPDQLVTLEILARLELLDRRVYRVTPDVRDQQEQPVQLAQLVALDPLATRERLVRIV